MSESTGAAARGAGPRTPWWRDTVGYEVYVRSFVDGDGDGVGDLPGVRRRLPYLADLGVEVVWLTPFYPSPQADHGYDVADYRDVDPVYGTLEDAEALFADAHDLGLRVLVDLVPNHTSDQHPWFRDALTGRDAEHRDWYVWRDPAPDGGPPNNWVSHFGGPAWTLHEPTGQYYMHLFLPEQPDLNWTNPAVREAFDDILRFWLERGADGFRIDVAHSLMEDREFRDNPLIGDVEDVEELGPRERFAAYEHQHDMDHPEVLDVYRRWRSIAEEHDALLLGEVYLLDPRSVARYVEDQDGLHQAFCFLVLHVGWDPDQLRDAVRRGVAAASPHLAWPVASHDDPRAATRFGGGALGSRRAQAFLALLLALPGATYLFQGEELGLEDGIVDREELEDPISTRNPGAVGRDGSRTPMPWGSGHALGFTDGEPWLPTGSNHSAEDTVAAQRGDPESWLERTRSLLRVHASTADVRDGGTLTWLGTDGGPLVAFARGEVVVACNVGSRTAELRLPGGGRWEVLHVTAGEATVEAGALRVPPDTTAWAVRR